VNEIARCRNYDDKPFLDFINPESLTMVTNSKAEPVIVQVERVKDSCFEREGYFCLDLKEDGVVFNRTVTLRDSWAKIESKGN